MTIRGIRLGLAVKDKANKKKAYNLYVMCESIESSLMGKRYR